jgi:hypothetical protein
MPSPSREVTSTSIVSPGVEIREFASITGLKAYVMRCGKSCWGFSKI